MLITVFRSRLKPDLRDEYAAAVERMSALARTMPGHISHKTFYAEDGERCTIVEFAHEEGQRVWQTNAEHRMAQKAGAGEILHRVQHSGLHPRARVEVQAAGAGGGADLTLER
jgi:heme-degrading monooxygenase HmoA